ncbi:hypothetical protein E0Z10_g6346 [Xylaria hypoxylon]|uniref:Cep57 centrosome microtubule-binding domain-containing protein n=1 Tax=Xylaria hypoxylon TaxID=37992 RepID=A0A4Z0YTL1_9PEZI|nr:hypothetical protein E0Z10_g6346 [Xylaria hypoxylon]
MDSKKSRQFLSRSRILREMRNQAEHPWSPPSSTGSHGTVTLTSEISHILPDRESTHEPTFPRINTSALIRHFPEWKGYQNPDDEKEKENKKPSSPAIINNDNNDTASIFGPDSPRLRTHHQVPVVEDTMELNPPLNPPRGNLTTLLDTLQTARSEKVQTDEESVKRSSQISPKSQLNAGFSAHAARRYNRQSHPPGNYSTMSPSIINQTAHSFFLPNFNHLHDLVSGTLRWSSLKNGTPIFVKHGRVHDRETKASLDYHADFEDVSIPLEEEEIFVSLDKIREEIQTLQEHDEFVSKEAEQLQDEVCELQAHLAKLKSRKDSAMGSESDSSMILQLNTQKSQLEEQIASLKTRLDQASRKISQNGIHNQSVVEERDGALQRVSDHVITIKRLQARNDAITQQKLELQQALQETEEELGSERDLLNSLHQKYDMISEEKNLLKQDNLGLERHNEQLYNNNKLLQEQNALLGRENTTLRNKAAQLQELVDELNKKLSQKTETQYTQQAKGFVPSLGKSKLTKMTQNWESEDRFTVVSETSAKSMTSQVHLPKQDNDTRESNLTRDSRRRFSQESKGSIPVTGKSKLAKMAQIQESRDRHTVASEMSAKTTTSHTDLQMQDDYTQQIDLTREPELDSDHENMTSALFIDDVTLDSNKKFAQKLKPKQKATPTVRVLSPVLSVTEPSTQTEHTGSGKQKEVIPPTVLTQSAKHVLNNLCQDHECYNCMVCARIQSHRHESNGKCGKKTVRIDRPVPVTDRVRRQPSTSATSYVYEDQPTLRPSQDPAIALAKVMKGLKDEERHIRTSIARKQAVYDECDAAINKRLWKQLDAEIRVLRKRRDLKRDQIYDLHDVLEGQKANAQLMSQEAIDMTITSVLSKDPTWNGIMDY